jgi:hypothetical protein
MPIKRKIITVPKGQVENICRSMNVKRATVYNALNYNSNSESAQLIRRLAISTYGGVETSKIIF